MALKSQDKAESTEMIAYKFVGYPDEEAKSLMTGFQHGANELIQFLISFSISCLNYSY